MASTQEWREIVDPGSGKTYYYNAATKKTAWEKPKARPSTREEVWLEKIDQKSGKVYFYNPKTKVTSWSKPAGASLPSVPSEVPSVEGAPKSGTKEVDNVDKNALWLEKIDQKSRKTYYFNPKTKVTSWSKPDGLIPITKTFTTVDVSPTGERTTETTTEVTWVAEAAKPKEEESPLTERAADEDTEKRTREEAERIAREEAERRAFEEAAERIAREELGLRSAKELEDRKELEQKAEMPTEQPDTAPAASSEPVEKEIPEPVRESSHAQHLREAVGGLAVEALIAPSAGSMRSLGSVLRRGKWLSRGQTLVSANGSFCLIHQLDGEVAMYMNRKCEQWNLPVWQTKTWARQTSRLAMQSDGNLVLYDVTNQPIWASGTCDSGAAYAELQNDGNLVLFTSTGQPKWDRHRGPRAAKEGVWTTPARGIITVTESEDQNCLHKGCQLVQGQSLISSNNAYRLTHRPDGNVVLFHFSDPIWATNTCGHQTSFLALQMDGNLVLLNRKSRTVWSSDTCGSGADYAELQDDGNLVLFTKLRQPKWDRICKSECEK